MEWLAQNWMWLALAGGAVWLMHRGSGCGMHRHAHGHGHAPAPRRAPGRRALLRSSVIGIVLLFALARAAAAAAGCAPLPEACPTGAPAMPVSHHDQGSVHPLDHERGGVCATQLVTSDTVAGVATSDASLDEAAAPPRVTLTVAQASLVAGAPHAGRSYAPPSPLALFSRLRL